jgi:hypothetical protein
MIAVHRDQPVWLGLHVAGGTTALIGTAWPRAWIIPGVIAGVTTLWGGWHWARILSAWVTPHSPIALEPGQTDPALREAGELTVVTLWLNIVLMVAWMRKPAATPPP